MWKPIYLLIIIAVGGISAVQVGVNSQLGLYLGHPLRAAFANFALGTGLLGLTLAGWMVLGGLGWPSVAQLGTVPWYGWLGGLCGATFVLSTVMLAPKVGASTFAACIIGGQLVVAAVLDHYGWLGFAQQQIGLSRFMGIALLMLGIWLIQR